MVTVSRPNTVQAKAKFQIAKDERRRDNMAQDENTRYITMKERLQFVC
jgi:hypothetical protein